jgi:hypothetical protein
MEQTTYAPYRADALVDGTLILKLFQYGAWALCILMAVFLTLSIIKSLNRYAEALEAQANAAPEDGTPAPLPPRLPAMRIALGILVIIGLMMASSTLHIWMPKTDTSAPSVNRTIERQIMNQRETVPVVIEQVDQKAIDDAAAAARRQQLIDQTRGSFETLPDDK